MTTAQAHALAAKSLIRSARIAHEMGADVLRDRLMDEADAQLGLMVEAMPSGRTLT